MVNIKDIKLIIWDLDDTFWNGTISEGQISPIEKNIQFVKNLTDVGIINSICSKNDFDVASDKLKELNVWNYFVFPSINWENKAQRIKSMIDNMALRPVNVLFLDDNQFNLNEAKHFLPDMMVEFPSVIDDLIAQLDNVEKKDINHKRLKQYKVLEEKNKESLKYDSNEEFLYDSHILVDMVYDCLPELDRLHELIIRSNQLNFTKKRISIEELKSILDDEKFKCGYVKVKDKFGDYGIVGFFALNIADNYLEHFVFSCRTMGQGIEQWVYGKLGSPKLDVVGEVRTKLLEGFIPQYINNQSQVNSSEKIEKLSCEILLKGPCDLSHSQMYIKTENKIDTDFTYVNGQSGQIIDAYNHSVHILGLKEYTEEEKKQIIDDCIFVDPKMLSGNFFTKKYNVIFLSTLIEAVYCIYKKKGTNIRVVFGPHDLTNSNNWEDLISGKKYNGGNKFTKEYLQSFSEKYEFVGYTTPEMYVEFLRKVLSYLDKSTNLCLILGSTFPLEGFENHAKYHSEFNKVVKEFVKTQENVCVIEMDDIAKNREDYTDSLNHYTTKVYYGIALAMIDIIKQKTDGNVSQLSSSFVYIDKCIFAVRRFLKSILAQDSAIYKLCKNIYLKLTRRSDNVK